MLSMTVTNCAELMHHRRAYMPQHQQYQQDPSISSQVALLQQFAAVLSHQSRPTHDQHHHRQVFQSQQHLHDESPTVLHFNTNSHLVDAPEQHSDHTQLACINQRYPPDAPPSPQLPHQQQELLQMLLAGLQQQQQSQQPQQINELQSSHAISQLQTTGAVNNGQHAPSQLQLLQHALSIVLAGADVDDGTSAAGRHVPPETLSPRLGQGGLQPHGPVLSQVESPPRSAERPGLVGSLYSFTLAGRPPAAHDQPQQGHHAVEVAGHDWAWGQQSPRSDAPQPSHHGASRANGLDAARSLGLNRHAQLRYPARQQQQHPPVVQPSPHPSHPTVAQPPASQQHWLWQQQQRQHQPPPQPQSQHQQHQRSQHHGRLEQMPELQHPTQRQHLHEFPQPRQQLALEDSVQQVVLSYEMLALLTMIAAAAVHSADKSSADDPLPAASLGHEVLSAARAFLGALTRMTLATSSDAAAVDLPETSPLSPADQHRGNTIAADTEAEAEAAAALCDMPMMPHEAGSGFMQVLQGAHAERSPRGLLAAEEVASRPQRGRPRKADVAARGPAQGREPAHPAGGLMANNKHGHQQASQGRSSLMALLQALKDNEHGEPEEEAGAPQSSLDWTADAAHDDQEPGRSRVLAARRAGRPPQRRQRDLSPTPRDSSAHTVSPPVSNSTSSDVGYSDAPPRKRRRHSQHLKNRHGPSRGQLAAGGSAGGVRAAADASPSGNRYKPGKGGHAAEAEGQPAAKKTRWVAGTHQWTTKDGLVVWPKATQISQEHRVFYVAFKWVQEHWPEHVTSNLHITDVPVDLYLDGEKADMQDDLKAKIRVYSTAAHLVVAPYGQLAALHSNSYLAGYAFDTAASRIRLYLSTAKPDLTAGPGPAVAAQRLQQPPQQQPSSGDSAAEHTAAPEGSVAHGSEAARQLVVARKQQKQAISAATAGDASAPTQDHTTASAAAAAGGNGGTDRQAGCWQRLKRQLDTLCSNSKTPLLDATTVNNAVLCISDALQLPDDLLVGIPGQLMKGLVEPHSITAGASSASEVEATAGGQVQQQPPHQGDMGLVNSVQAELQLWYQQLCAAVAACDKPQVTLVLRQLSSKVLAHKPEAAAA